MNQLLLLFFIIRLLKIKLVKPKEKYLIVG